MARWITRKKKERDKVIACGTVIEEVPANTMEIHPIPVGTELEFARIIRTPVGRSMRIAHTKRWVNEGSIKAEFESKLVFDYTGTIKEETVPPSWDKAKKDLVKSQKKTAIKTNRTNKRRIKTKNKPNKQFKNRIRFVINNSEVRVRTRLGACGMKKAELKTVISALTPGEQVRFTFLGEKAGQTGDFEVLQTRVGRGKGGSMLIELRTSAGETLVTGTPESDLVLHVVTSDGVLHGYETEASVPPVFETNAGAAALLKEKFLLLLDAESQYTVKVTSTHQPYNGQFTVVSAKQLRGRYGQVVLTLGSGPGTETFELWSHRHSVAVAGFEVIERL